MNHKLKMIIFYKVRLTRQDEVNPNDMQLQVIKYIFYLYYFIIHAVVRKGQGGRERERRRVACWIQPLESSAIQYSTVCRHWILDRVIVEWVLVGQLRNTNDWTNYMRGSTLLGLLTQFILVCGTNQGMVLHNFHVPHL